MKDFMVVLLFSVPVHVLVLESGDISVVRAPDS